MNRIKIFQSLSFSLLLIGATGCIKDDISDCHPEESHIDLSVKDKNYFNIDNIPSFDRMDENSPFNTFIQALNYSLQNKITGEVVESTFLSMTNTQNTTHRLTFRNLPEGEYELAVFGNTTPDVPLKNLHPENKSYADIYIADTTFHVGPKQDDPVNLPLERAKGLLLITCDSFPSTITKMEKEITSIYPYTDAKKNYSDITSIKENTPLKKSNPTYIAPSVRNVESNLKLNFYNDSDSLLLKVPSVALKFKRNEVTVVSLIYKPENKVYEVWSNIDGKWTKYHQLTFK